MVSLKLIVEKMSKIPEKVNMLDSKVIKGK